MQNQSWIELDEVINAYIDRSEQSVHRYFKLWHICFDGMQYLGLDFFYQIKSLKLPINSNFTVNLPDDYLNWSKVGVLNDRGEIIPMSYNSKLTFYGEQTPDRISKTQDNTIFNYFQYNSPIWYNFWTGYNFTTLYGIPSGAPFVGNFKIDNHTGVMLLDENFQFEYVMLEYVSSPQEGGKYYIPVQFKEALIWFLAWQDISMLPNSRRGTLGDKEQRKHNFFNERRLGWARYKPLNLIEAYDWSQKAQRLTVKI